MDKFLVTPSSSARKKRAIEHDVVVTSDSASSADDEEDRCDDTNYDLSEMDVIECTQAYGAQGPAAFEEDEENAFHDDGLTQTHDFTQEAPEELEDVQPQAFHEDTDEQVFVDEYGPMGVRRIFKLGESFMSSVPAAKLCRENTLADGVSDAVYTIRKFYSKGLVKTADCMVKIPSYHTFPHQSEKARLRKSHGEAKKVTLRKTERIELRKLDNRLVDNVPLEVDLLYEVSIGANYDISYKEPYTMRGSFYVPPPFENITVLELFAGAGGMSQGFTNAGFDVRWMVEKDPQAAATLKLNHQRGDARVFQESVENFLRKANDAKMGYPSPGQVHHIHASSPCQGYSKANRNGGINDEANNMLAFAWIDYIQHFKPETASFENVTGMLCKTGKDKNDGAEICYWQRLLSKLLLEVGYQFRARIVRASDFGDPQERRRLFIIAAKRGRPLPDFPNVTNGASIDLDPLVSVEQALQDLVLVEPELEGENGPVELRDKSLTTDHSFAGKLVARKQAIKSESKKLAADKPSHTVMRANGIEHYSLKRNLTVRELARLQSFPDTYEFCGSVTQKRSQIGNAVPVKLATAIAKSIRSNHY